MYMPALFNDSLFDDLFTDFNQANGRRPKNRMNVPGVMKTDIKETDKEYELSIELPGYKKEDVNAELKDGYLIISAREHSMWAKILRKKTSRLNSRTVYLHLMFPRMSKSFPKKRNIFQ